MRLCVPLAEPVKRHHDGAPSSLQFRVQETIHCAPQLPKGACRKVDASKVAVVDVLGSFHEGEKTGVAKSVSSMEEPEQTAVAEVHGGDPAGLRADLGPGVPMAVL